MAVETWAHSDENNFIQFVPAVDMIVANVQHYILLWREGPCYTILNCTIVKLFGTLPPKVKQFKTSSNTNTEKVSVMWWEYDSLKVVF